MFAALVAACFLLLFLAPSSLAHPNPSAPINLAPLPSGWSSQNDFAVSWTNPAHDKPITAARYKIGNPPVSADDGVLIFPLPTPPQIFGIQVPAAGQHQVWVTLIDSDGTSSYPDSTSTNLKYDPDSPIQPAVESAGKWLTAADLPYEQKWLPPDPLPLAGLKGYATALVKEGEDSNPGSQVTDVPTQFPSKFISGIDDGIYAFSVKAISKRKGRSISSFKVSKGRSRLKSLTIGGSISAKKGDRIAALELTQPTVKLYSKRYTQDDAWKLIKELPVDPLGLFNFTVERKPVSTLYKLVIPGTKRRPTITKLLKQSVETKVSLNAKTTSVGTVKAKGKILSPGFKIPKGGKALYLQYRSKGEQRWYLAARTTSRPSGNYHFSFTPPTALRNKELSLRAVVTHDPTRPYSKGYSRIAKSKGPK